MPASRRRSASSSHSFLSESDSPGMPKQVFNPPALPAAIGPYSWATRSGQLVFLAGTASIGPDGKLVGAGDIRKQTEVTLENLKVAVTAAGGSLANVVKTTVYIDDIANYAGM